MEVAARYGYDVSTATLSLVVRKMYKVAGYDAPTTPAVATEPDAATKTDRGETPEQTAAPEPPGEAASLETPAKVDVAARAVVATSAGGAIDARTTSNPASAGQNQDQSGPRVLQNEVMMIAQLPAVVQAIALVGAQLGSEVDLVTLATGQVLFSATLPAGLLGSLTIGAVGAFAADGGRKDRPT